MTHGLHGQAGHTNAFGELAVERACPARPLMLVLMSGTTGSGKSTVAMHIAARWGFAHLQTDVIRKGLAGLGPMARTDSGVREGLYSPAMSVRTYREMERLAAETLATGRSVIMDGTFLRRTFRSRSASAIKIALSRAGVDPAGVAVVIVECFLSKEEQLARLEERYASGRSESEGRPEVYRAQAAAWQPAKDAEAYAIVRLDTSAREQDVANAALDALRRAALSFRPDAAVRAGSGARGRRGAPKAT
ncbi:MAG: hypothetical protein EXR57_06445 [Dehalococcoidia bacterium]|nr:hypothetical protein [Dehalococcoidia bacterium]